MKHWVNVVVLRTFKKSSESYLKQVFEPEIIKKHEKAVNGLEEQIIAMYAKDMSTRDIEDHIRDIYGIDVSAGMASKVTDNIMP
ncbi:MAG: hypothetical protein VR66_20040 [Peptococcaceae bacterium BRH_c23]|nr:MAG: hypothetical protein VR66_20040 [Peptococcaceae bacterium BRH_c23]KJS88522.1 MAG: hypothetical protein JL57_11920 [Desulfosporosinus sp. BICA1-9]